MLKDREKGPVEILCKEIDFRFAPRMEEPAVLIAFVRELVDEISHERETSAQIAKALAFKQQVPSAASEDALAAAYAMLGANDTAGAIAAAARLHDLTHQDEDGPCDHFLDMLSSCASAIRFGLEVPCRSRHAASAADHVWRQVYGLSRFDNHSLRWQADWARAKLQDALTRMALAAPSTPKAGSSAAVALIPSPRSRGMSQYRKKPVVIEAWQWFRNGDHPLDYSQTHDGFDGGELRQFTPEERRAKEWEGDIVRYFRHPETLGGTVCKHCGKTMHEHGWIDTLEGGHIVCPGDWIITGVKGEHYPCKPDIFEQTYEAVP